MQYILRVPILNPIHTESSLLLVARRIAQRKLYSGKYMSPTVGHWKVLKFLLDRESIC